MVIAGGRASTGIELGEGKGSVGDTPHSSAIFTVVNLHRLTVLRWGILVLIYFLCVCFFMCMAFAYEARGIGSLGSRIRGLCESSLDGCWEPRENNT